MAAAINLLGTNLPGLRWRTHHPVHVGVQRGLEVVQLTSGDAVHAEFHVPVDVVIHRGQTPELSGPYVHGGTGPDGDQFVYLSWGELVDGTFTMFRRAKVPLHPLPADVADTLAAGGQATAALELTDSHGAPICAAIPPDHLHWHGQPASSVT